MKSSQIKLRIILTVIVFWLSSCNLQKKGAPAPTLMPTIIVDEVGKEKKEANELPEVKENNKLVQIPPGLELEFWHPWSGETAELIDEMIDQFNDENPWSLTINSIGHADEGNIIHDLTNAFINKSDFPDVIVSTSQSLRSWYLKGYPIQELDELIALETDDAPFPEIFPIFWNIDLVQGMRIGIPAFQSGNFLFYNQTWGKELGFDTYPDSIEAFIKQTCAAAVSNRYDKKNNKNGTGGWIYSDEALPLLAWMKAFGGGELVNAHSQVVLSESGNEDALSFLFDLYVDDCAWTGKKSQPYGYFSDRFALMYSGKMEDIIEQMEINRVNETGDEWMVIPYPSNVEKPIIIVEGLSFALTTEERSKKLAAWEFIKWMMKPENQATIVENTGVFPLSNEVIQQVDKDTEFYPIWNSSLQFLPFSEPEPTFEQWYMVKRIIKDIGWQLIQYTTKRENIHQILTDAEELVRGFE